MIARQPTLTIETLHGVIPIAIGFWDGNAFNGNYFEVLILIYISFKKGKEFPEGTFAFFRLP